VILVGQVIVGRILSDTITVYEHVAVLPEASRTVYVTVVVPMLNVNVPRLLIPVAADAPVVAPVSAHVNTVTPQLSPVVGFGVTTEAVHVPAPTFAVMFAGQVTVGRILSDTVTV
jgi:hypothetical protein